MTRTSEDEGLWVVESGFGKKSSYKNKWTFPRNHKSRAWIHYNSILVHSGGKKRIYDPTGKRIDLQITTQYSS